MPDADGDDHEYGESQTIGVPHGSVGLFADHNMIAATNPAIAAAANTAIVVAATSAAIENACPAKDRIS